MIGPTGDIQFGKARNQMQQLHIMTKSISTKIGASAENHIA